jgi:integrase
MIKQLHTIQLPITDATTDKKIFDFCNAYKRKTKLDNITTKSVHVFFELLKTEKKLAQNSIYYLYHGLKRLVKNTFLFESSDNIASIQYAEFFSQYKIKAENNKITNNSIFSVKEIELLCKKANAKYKLLIYFLYLSGVRIHELIQAKLDDCKIENDIVIVTIKHGKFNKRRDIIIPKDLYFEIRNKFSGLIYLFETKPGKQFGKTTIQRYLQKLSKRIDKRITPHLLRHSFITNHLEKKTEIKVLSHFVGTKPETILKVYAHPKINNKEFLNTITEGTKYANTI